MFFWQATTMSQGGWDSWESCAQPSLGEHSTGTWQAQHTQFSAPEHRFIEESSAHLFLGPHL